MECGLCVDYVDGIASIFDCSSQCRLHSHLFSVDILIRSIVASNISKARALCVSVLCCLNAFIVFALFILYIRTRSPDDLMLTDGNESKNSNEIFRDLITEFLCIVTYQIVQWFNGNRRVRLCVCLCTFQLR